MHRDTEDIHLSMSFADVAYYHECKKYTRDLGLQQAIFPIKRYMAWENLRVFLASFCKPADACGTNARLTLKAIIEFKFLKVHESLHTFSIQASVFSGPPD